MHSFILIPYSKCHTAIIVAPSTKPFLTFLKAWHTAKISHFALTCFNRANKFISTMIVPFNILFYEFPLQRNNRCNSQRQLKSFPTDTNNLLKTRFSLVPNWPIGFRGVWNPYLLLADEMVPGYAIGVREFPRSISPLTFDLWPGTNTHKRISFVSPRPSLKSREYN